MMKNIIILATLIMLSVACKPVQVNSKYIPADTMVERVISTTDTLPEIHETIGFGDLVTVKLQNEEDRLLVKVYNNKLIDMGTIVTRREMPVIGWISIGGNGVLLLMFLYGLWKSGRIK